MISASYRERVLAEPARAPALSLKERFSSFGEDVHFTFLETIEPIRREGMIPQVMEMARITYTEAVRLKSRDLQEDLLDAEGIAALRKYTAEDTTPSLYADMNAKCRDEERGLLVEPFLNFMWLMLKSMLLVEPYPNKTVYRGVKLNLKDQYETDSEVTWYSFSSCTNSLKSLERPDFCGKTGERTIFVIKLSQGQARDIAKYSALPGEAEVLLPPGCSFKVTGVMDVGSGCTIVTLDEVPSREWIIDLSGSPPSSVSKASVSRTSVSRACHQTHRKLNATSIDEGLAEQILACTNAGELVRLEPNMDQARPTWMIWMVHRAYLNDPTLVKFDFTNLQMPPGHEEPRISLKLWKSIEGNSHIQELLLPNTNLNAGEGALLAASLRSNTTLRVLNVDSNFLSQDDLMAIVNAAGTSRTLQELRVNHQHGVAPGRQLYEALVNALQANTMIVKLGLSVDNPHFRGQIDKQIMQNVDKARKRRLEAKKASP